MSAGPAGGAPAELWQELGAVDEEPPGAIPAERQALLDERAFLLRSLRDLEDERDAGDLAPADYEALRSRYASRAAAVLRALSAPAADPDGSAPTATAATATPGDTGTPPAAGTPGDTGTPPAAGTPGDTGTPPASGTRSAPGTRAPSGTAEPAAAAGRRRRRRWLVGGAVACFAVAAVIVVTGAMGVGLPGNPVTGSLTLTHRQQVQRLLAQGEAALLQNDSATALDAFEQALSIDPTQEEALSEAGWLQFAAGVRAHDGTLVRQGQADEQKAVANAPGDAGARFYLAAMLAQEGSTNQAVAEFEAALHDNPTDATVAAFAATIDKVFGQARVPVPASVGQAVAAVQAAGPHGTPAPAGAGSSPSAGSTGT